MGGSFILNEHGASSGGRAHHRDCQILRASKSGRCKASHAPTSGKRRARWSWLPRAWPVQSGLARFRDTRRIGTAPASVPESRKGFLRKRAHHNRWCFTAGGNGEHLLFAVLNDHRPALHFTVIKSRILENSPSLIPFTFMMSSIVLNGRASMMA